MPYQNHFVLAYLHIQVDWIKELFFQFQNVLYSGVNVHKV